MFVNFSVLHIHQQNTLSRLGIKFYHFTIVIGKEREPGKTVSL